MTESKLTPNQFSLKGSVAVVTGASRGIGNVISKGLYDAGATVHGVARSQSPLGAIFENERYRYHSITSLNMGKLLIFGLKSQV